MTGTSPESCDGVDVTEPPAVAVSSSLPACARDLQCATSGTSSRPARAAARPDRACQSATLCARRFRRCLVPLLTQVADDAPGAGRVPGGADVAPVQDQPAVRILAELGRCVGDELHGMCVRSRFSVRKEPFSTVAWLGILDEVERQGMGSSSLDKMQSLRARLDGNCVRLFFADDVGRALGSTRNSLSGSCLSSFDTLLERDAHARRPSAGAYDRPRQLETAAMRCHSLPSPRCLDHRAADTIRKEGATALS